MGKQVMNISFQYPQLGAPPEHTITISKDGTIVSTNRELQEAMKQNENLLYLASGEYMFVFLSPFLKLCEINLP